MDNVEKAEEFLCLELPTLVIKRGSQGAVLRSGKEKYTAFPPVVDVVDAVGAGDSFDAGFIHQFIRGAKLEDCLQYGNACGALSTTRAGGTEAFRDARHREAFLRKHAANLMASGPMTPSSTR
jgi:sugar/nucleoside kinase (ribokinase family)